MVCFPPPPTHDDQRRTSTVGGANQRRRGSCESRDQSSSPVSSSLSTAAPLVQRQGSLLEALSGHPGRTKHPPNPPTLTPPPWARVVPGLETGERRRRKKQLRPLEPGICHQSDLREQSGNAGARLGRLGRSAHTPPIVLAAASVDAVHDAGIYTFRDLFAIYLSSARTRPVCRASAESSVIRRRLMRSSL